VAAAIQAYLLTRGDTWYVCLQYEQTVAWMFPIILFTELLMC